MAHINCGYISQNVYIYCASAGLATIVRGWIDKDAIAKNYITCTSKSNNSTIGWLR